MTDEVDLIDIWHGNLTFLCGSGEVLASLTTFIYGFGCFHRKYTYSND